MAEQANIEAIEESLAQARQNGTLPKEFLLNQHYACNYKGAKGAIQQYNTINQYHPSFQTLIDKYNTTSMICGYVSIVHARLLQHFFQSNHVARDAPLSSDWANLAVDMITSDTERIMEDTESVMSRIREKRKEFIQSHEEDFQEEKSKNYYERALVADYEISDELFRSRKSDNGEGVDDTNEDEDNAISIYLWRPNNYPEVDCATHEERARIEVEDAVFGNDVKHIIERKRPQHHENTKEGKNTVERFSPYDWGKLKSEEEKDVTNIFVINLHGHFCTCVSTQIYKNATNNGQGGSSSPALFFFNTCDGKLISDMEDSTMGCMYDTIFQ